MKRIYLDYAATTPVDPRVLESMLPYFGVSNSKLSAISYNLEAGLFGNPGSLHQFGQRASAAVFESRQTIAKALGAHYSEIIFTGSATEANNLALRGALKAFSLQLIANSEEGVAKSLQLTADSGSDLKAISYKLKAESSSAARPRVIVSAIEHESVLNTAKDLVQDGADVVILPVSKDGIVDLKKFKESLNEQTALVLVMYANNETGVVQPIAEISKIVKEFRGTKQWPLLHTDAVQAFQYMECNVDELGVDLMTLSAQKVYGPKGIGALYCKKQDVRSKKYGEAQPLTLNSNNLLLPQIAGGGQEQGLRSGTENVPAIVGFAQAVELVEKLREKEIKRIGDLRDYAWQGIKKIFPKAQLNGPSFAKASKGRLPNNLNMYIPKLSGEQTLISLDLKGIAVSSGSACTARSIDPSHVLLAMGHDKVRAKNSIRITLGRPTTKGEIDTFLKVLNVVSK